MASILLLLAFNCSGCSFFQDESISPTTQELIKQHKYKEAEALLLDEINKAKSAAAVAEAKSDSKGIKRNKAKLAMAYRNLAIVYYETGKYSQAQLLFLDAIKAHSSVFGRNDDFVVGILHTLAASYYKQGKLVEAEGYYKQEIDAIKAMRHPNPLKLAVTANNLAAIYQRLGEDVAAEKYFSWALSLCAGFKDSEKESDQMVDILNNLALFYEKEADYHQAMAMVDRALDIEEKRSKGFSENRVRSLLVRASIEKSTFNVESSEEDYKECLDLISKSKVPHPELACETLDKYADLLLVQRKFKEAEPQFQNCIQACEAAHGPEHPTVAERMSDFALLYRRTQRYAQAEELLRKAVAIEEKTVGVDTPNFLTTVHRLALVLADEKKYKEADALYQEIIPKLKKKLGADHPFVADTLDNWAEFVENSRGKKEADAIHEEARSIRRKLAHSLAPAYGPPKPQ
ncbi:MAG: tetratricopeptide repeat protein [Candidatus Obscuribacterales bacterium]|nr:tetratricopeptide repeat protein [Candidatus Obscuribacterales bacterium]